ncbi:hypothetical protein J6590_093552 [Homalodisca vitripennis]|nr:hypothetical protein J6590_093552 [Homalodisca vitripennis]
MYSEIIWFTKLVRLTSCLHTLTIPDHPVCLIFVYADELYNRMPSRSWMLDRDLWNITHDNILMSGIPDKSVLVGYADLSQLKLNQAMRLVNKWMADHGLSLRRRFLMTVVQSVLLYGAEVWADGLNSEAVKQHSVLLVTGVIPVKLSAVYRNSIYQRRGDDHFKKKERIKNRRDIRQHESRARWAARLIQVQLWAERQHGEVDY